MKIGKVGIGSNTAQSQAFSEFNFLVVSLFLLHKINLFPVHITSPQYTCAAFDSSALTDGCLRTLSLYSPGHVRSCTPCLRTGACPTCPTSLHGGTFWTSVRRSNNLHLNIALHPTIREQQVYTSGPQVI